MGNKAPERIYADAKKGEGGFWACDADGYDPQHTEYIRADLVPQWQPIETAPPLEPYLVIGPDWVHADVCISDEDGWWYSPVDGSDVMPQPTHYTDIPKGPFK